MKYTSYRGQRSDGVRNSLLVLLLGLALGVLGKWADFHSPLLSDLTSGAQLWIFLGCVLALYSRTPRRAALRVVLLLGGMVAAYYVTALVMKGVWSRSYAIGWGIAAAVSAVPGYLLWYAKGRTRRAWLLSLGVVAAQIAVMLALSGGVRVPDLAIILLTAAVLLLDKFGRGRR